jgi:hypothetical protein
VSACSDCFAPGSLTDLRWRMESCQARHRQLAQNRTHEIVNHARIGIAIFIASPSLGALCLRLAWREVRRRRFAHLSTARHYACAMIGPLRAALYQQDRNSRLRGNVAGREICDSFSSSWSRTRLCRRLRLQLKRTNSQCSSVRSPVTARQRSC